MSDKQNSFDEPEIIDSEEKVEFSATDYDNEDKQNTGESVILTATGQELYLITIDNEPEYYVETLKHAEECIWHIARLMCNADSDYTVSYVKRDNEIQVEKRYNWFLVSYDELIHRVRFDRIRGVCMKSVKSESIDE